MLIVLNDSATCHLGNKIATLNPGHYIGFKPGYSELHYLENLTDEKAQLLVICSHTQDDFITHDLLPINDSALVANELKASASKIEEPENC